MVALFPWQQQFSKLKVQIFGGFASVFERKPHVQKHFFKFNRYFPNNITHKGDVALTLFDMDFF